MEENPVPEKEPAYAFPVFDVDSPVKQISVASESFRCLFCKRSEVDELHIGPLYSLPEDKVTVHYYCMLFSAGLEQHGDDREGILGFMPEDIFKEVRRASRLKCLYCGISGASIGCNTSRCKASFHFPCGLANDANFQFVKNYQSYCKNHRQCSDFEVPDDHNCPICYNPIENERPVRGSCCKTAIFHKDCIQKQALSSGYFFKCPTCNSLENFHYETKLQGIYVPEQDASWEREPDAFQELYQQYEHCDSDKCECPKGRNYGANKGSWLLARCRVCGSAGTHRQCGKLTTIANWACNACLDFEARCDAKKVEEEESIVKAPQVLVVTTSVPSKPSENGEPSPPTIVEKRKRIRTGRKPPKRPQKKPEFVSPPTPPPPTPPPPSPPPPPPPPTTTTKTTRAKKEKTVVAVPEPKKVTEVKKSRKRKNENLIKKRGNKRRKRNDLTPEDMDWLETHEEEASVDLSKVHIGSACGDFFPYNKKVKKNFAMQGLDCFPDWRGYSLQVQVVNIFLDFVDPVLSPSSNPKTKSKVAKSVANDTVTQKNGSKILNPVLTDTANKKNGRKVVKPVPIDTAPKKNGRKVTKSDPKDTAPKRSGRKVVKSVLTEIIPKKSERNAAKSVSNETIPKTNERKVSKSVPTDVIPKKNERKVAKSVPTDVVPKKNERKVAKPIPTDVLPKKNQRKVPKPIPSDDIPKKNQRKAAKPIPTDVVLKKNQRKVAEPIPIDDIPKKNQRKAAKPTATVVTPQKTERKIAGSVPSTINTAPSQSQSVEKLYSMNDTKNTNTPIKTPKKQARRKRRSKWMRGVVKKKKTTSAKSKAPVKSKEIIESLKTADKKSDKASASKAILEGIRRSHESLLQFQQGKSTIKSTDEQAAPSDKKPKQNGVTSKIDEAAFEKGGTRRRPSQRGAVSETGNEGKTSENGDKNSVKAGSSKSENSIPNDCSDISGNEIPTTNNAKNDEPSSSSGGSRVPAQSNGTFQRRASGTRSCDKPIIKVEVDDTNNQRDSDHGGDDMDTSDASNRRINLAEELQNSARGIARELLQLSDRSEAHEKLRLLEQRCPQLFQKNVKK